LTLHERIERFRRDDVAAGRALMAVKWIGNEGSHGGRLDKKDLLDGFELLEHALSEVFGRRSKRLAAIERRITRRKGRR
jgi:hypothetical protein